MLGGDYSCAISNHLLTVVKHSRRAFKVDPTQFKIKIHIVKPINTNIFTDYFLKTTTSGSLWALLSEDMTEQYQCMTFWYTFYYCDGMSFYSTQEFTSHTLQMYQSLSDVQGYVQWVFGEMPLERFHAKSKVSTSDL